MKKYPILVLLFLCAAFTSFAGGISFIENKAWKDILALAKKQNKLIFLDAYATWCGPCKYLQSDVFTDSKVGEFFNKNFINVKIDMEAGEGPSLSEAFGVTSYPTLFFVNGNGELVHKAVGAMEVEEFLELGSAALDPDKQYFTVKKKIASGKLDAGVMDEWIHTASAMEDEDLQAQIATYLSKTSNSLIEGTTAEIVMHHAEYLTRAQLDLVWKNRASVMKTVEMDEEDFHTSFLEKVLEFAKKEATKSGVMDFAAYGKIVGAYYPDKVAVETAKAKVYYYSEKEKNLEAVNALSALLARKDLSAVDMAGAVVECTNAIFDLKRSNEFIAKVQNFTLMSKEKDQAYFKDLAIMMLYFRLENKDKVTEYNNRIQNSSSAPDNVKELAKKMVEGED